MGIFGNSSPFDEDVEKATSENNTREQWGLILEICDRAGASAAAARDCLRAALRRLGHNDPHVALQAATLLDAAVSNCGRALLLEVASRDFEAEFRRVLSRAQPAVADRLRQLLRKWAEGEFRDDPQLDLIPALHARLRREGETAPASPALPPPAAATAAAAAERREQEELARAIALSLREAGGAQSGNAAPPAMASSLYPRVEGVAPAAAAGAGAARPVRALYDFEAAEDNELTFLAGELVHVTDASDPNWWKGYNARGEGLFPANFVTSDLTEPQPTGEARAGGGGGGGKSVQFTGGEVAAGGASEEEEEGLDAGVLDAALAALHEADPEAAVGGDAAEAALARLEARAGRMGARVDAALQRADRRHAALTQLSAELVDALNLYHELMRAPPAPAPPAAPPQPPFYPPAAPAARY